MKKTNLLSTNKADSTPPPKKKRGRKRTKKRYFTEDTDLAIKQYLASSNQ